MYKKTIDFLKPDEVAHSVFNEEDNKVIVETAGFVPLEVKFKRFEQNGLIAQFNASEFTSKDYRDMYLNPDFEISPEDDYEEAFEKLRQQQEFINKMNINKTSDISEGNSEVAPKADDKEGLKQTVEEVQSE